MSDAKCCRHCGRPKVNRPRGLCWSCYYAPGTGPDVYPPTDVRGRRGIGGGMASRPPAPDPTDALPGTEEKVAEMAARVAAGFEPFRRGDPVLSPPPAMGGLLVTFAVPWPLRPKNGRVIRNKKAGGG